MGRKVYKNTVNEAKRQLLTTKSINNVLTCGYEGSTINYRGII